MDIQHKLDMIETLTAGELLGWWMHFRRFRDPYPGEIAALKMRAARLGVKLPLENPPRVA